MVYPEPEKTTHGKKSKTKLLLETKTNFSGAVGQFLVGYASSLAMPLRRLWQETAPSRHTTTVLALPAECFPKCELHHTFRRTL
jgi:hypothetical protein